MATKKIEKLKKEIASMEAVYSKQSTSEATKKILKRSIEAAKTKLEKEEALTKKLKTAMYGPKPSEEPKKEEPKKEEPSKPKRAAKPSTALSKLMRRVRSKGYEPYKGKKIDLLRDGGRKAKAPGKKVSKSGRTYWESRPNRIDLKQKAKKSPYLKEGGTVPSSAYGDMVYNTLESALSSIKSLVNPQNYSILKKDKKYMVTTNRRSGIFSKEGWENFGHVLSNSTLYRGTIGRLEFGGVAGYEEGGESGNIIDSYFEVAAKSPSVDSLKKSKEGDGFTFVNKDDNECKVTVYYDEDSETVVMKQDYQDGNPPDDDEVSISEFKKYLSNDKMKDGGYMAGGGEIPNTVEEFKKNMNNFEYKMGQAEKEWKKDNGEKYKQIRKERDEYVEKTKKAWYKTLSEEEKSNGGRYTIIKRMIEDAGLSSMAGGGDTSSPNVKFMKWFVDWSKGVDEHIHVSISIPNEFSSPVKDDSGKIVMLDVIEKKGDADAKKYMDEILKRADDFGVSIYLQPIPRTHNLKSQEHKDKITKDYLIKYYGKFGFENTDGGFMVRAPKMASGGYMAKGGATEHGLMVGDMIVLAKGPILGIIDENGEPVSVNIETGDRRSAKKEVKETNQWRIQHSNGEEYVKKDKYRFGPDAFSLTKYPELSAVYFSQKEAEDEIEKYNLEESLNSELAVVKHRYEMADGGETEYASGGNVMKDYEKVEGTNYELKIQVYYDKGGMNYFTSRPEQRGYYASVTPVQVERRPGGIMVESYAAFSGVKMLVLPVQRQSPKAEAEARQKAMEVLPELKEAIKERIKSKMGK
jgi:hypothetical protein